MSTNQSEEKGKEDEVTMETIVTKQAICKKSLRVVAFL